VHQQALTKVIDDEPSGIQAIVLMLDMMAEILQTQEEMKMNISRARYPSAGQPPGDNQTTSTSRRSSHNGNADNLRVKMKDQETLPMKTVKGMLLSMLKRELGDNVWFGKLNSKLLSRMRDE
jgi:hypothetical protein